MLKKHTLCQAKGNVKHFFGLFTTDRIMGRQERIKVQVKKIGKIIICAFIVSCILALYY